LFWILNVLLTILCFPRWRAMLPDIAMEMSSIWMRHWNGYFSMAKYVIWISELCFRNSMKHKSNIFVYYLFFHFHILRNSMKHKSNIFSLCSLHVFEMQHNTWTWIMFWQYVMCLLQIITHFEACALHLKFRWTGSEQGQNESFLILSDIFVMNQLS